jgi:hypothetical protein
MDEQFEILIQTEAGCRQVLSDLRFGNRKFKCSDCSCEEAYEIRTRGLLECKACHKQFSATSGTIFHNTRTPLPKLFKIVFDVASGIRVSAAQHARDLNMVESTAWRHRHRIRILLDERFPPDNACKVNRIQLLQVLFRRSIETPANSGQKKKLEAPQDIDLNLFEPRSEEESRSVSQAIKFVSETYHGVSQKYSQLYTAELRFFVKEAKIGIREAMKALIMAGPVSVARISAYSSPQFIDLPKRNSVLHMVPEFT